MTDDLGMAPWRTEETPILSKLVGQAAATRFPLHVPGHQQGRALPLALAQWLGAAAQLDLTELPGLDNLHHAQGCILESQNLAAQHYRSEACLYSVNGSSAAVVAGIAGVVPPGGRVLFLNPFHISAWRGLVYVDAEPVLPNVLFRDPQDAFRVPTVVEAADALAAGGAFDAVFLTSPTYRGEAAEVAQIAELVHGYDVPLIVDEAHGAHFGLHPSLPMHSVAAGADVVVQSVHKTLPGLTQTAWLHCNGVRVDAQRVADMLRSFQSTSPSYLLLASLDVAQAWLRLEGSASAERAIQVLEAFGLRGQPTHARSGDAVLSDPLRHFVRTSSSEDSVRLQRMLEAVGYFVEYADADGVLCIFGLSITPVVVEQYLEVLRAWEAGASGGEERTASDVDWRTAGDDALHVNLCVRPREAHFAKRMQIPIDQCTGRIAAELVAPYPPGIPVVWPGQRLDYHAVRRLSTLAQSGADVHGLGRGGTLAVIR